MSDPIYLGSGDTYDPALAADPDKDFQSTLSDTAVASAQDSFYNGATASFAKVGASAAKYFPGNLTGSTPLFQSQDQLQDTTDSIMQEYARQKAQEEFIMSARPQTYAGFAASTGGSLAGSLADPLNSVGLAIAPARLAEVAGAGLSRVGMDSAAASATKLAESMQNTVIGRTVGSSLNNASMVALQQPIILAGDMQEHIDYSYQDGANQVLYGGLLGGALHGVGEALGANWSAFRKPQGATVRTATNVGLDGVENGYDASGLSNDVLRTDRSVVEPELASELGRPPTEPEIQAEVQARQLKVTQDKVSGEYLPQEEPTPAPSGELDVGGKPESQPAEGESLTRPTSANTDQITELAGQGKYKEATQSLEEQNKALAEDPSLRLSPQDKLQAEEPMQNHQQAQSAIQDFISCIGAEVS